MVKPNRECSNTAFCTLILSRKCRKFSLSLSPFSVGRGKLSKFTGFRLYTTSASPPKNFFQFIYIYFLKLAATDSPPPKKKICLPAQFVWLLQLPPPPAFQPTSCSRHPAWPPQWSTLLADPGSDLSGTRSETWLATLRITRVQVNDVT